MTAVEILYKFLFEMESFNGFDPYHFNNAEVFNKAIEIEKEQIIRAHESASLDAGFENSAKDWAEEYYNKLKFKNV